MQKGEEVADNHRKEGDRGKHEYSDPCFSTCRCRSTSEQTNITPLEIVAMKAVAELASLRTHPTSTGETAPSRVEAIPTASSPVQSE